METFLQTNGLSSKYKNRLALDQVNQSLTSISGCVKYFTVIILGGILNGTNGI